MTAGKELEDAQKEMLAVRALKEREMLRDMVSITALGGIIGSGGLSSFNPEIIEARCKLAYAYADEMLKVRDSKS
jgi:hypothetical protein